MWPLGWLVFWFCPLPMTFTWLLPHPPMEELLPLPLELFLLLPLPWIMDDCVANAPSNDVFDLLILCSWLMSEACNSSMVNTDRVFVFFQGHNQGFKSLGKTSENFFNHPLAFYVFSKRFQLIYQTNKSVVEWVYLLCIFHWQRFKTSSQNLQP